MVYKIPTHTERLIRLHIRADKRTAKKYMKTLNEEPSLPKTRENVCVRVQRSPQKDLNTLTKEPRDENNKENG